MHINITSNDSNINLHLEMSRPSKNVTSSLSNELNWLEILSKCVSFYFSITFAHTYTYTAAVIHFGFSRRCMVECLVLMCVGFRSLPKLSSQDEDGPTPHSQFTGVAHFEPIPHDHDFCERVVINVSQSYYPCNVEIY